MKNKDLTKELKAMMTRAEKRAAEMEEIRNPDTPLTNAELIRIVADDSTPLNNEVDRMADFARELERKTRLLKILRNALGYVQNGSETTITISQDDATRCFHAKVGNETFWATSFEGLLEQLPSANPELDIK